MKYSGYKTKKVSVNGAQMWAIVRYWFWGLIECPLMPANMKLMATPAQAEKERMRLEIEQQSKKK